MPTIRIWRTFTRRICTSTDSEAGGSRCLDKHVYFDVQVSATHRPLVHFERACRLAGRSRRVFFWLQFNILKMNLAHGRLNVDPTTVSRQINLGALEAGAARERDIHAHRDLIFDTIDNVPPCSQRAHPLELRVFAFDSFDAARHFKFPSDSSVREYDDKRIQVEEAAEVPE